MTNNVVSGNSGSVDPMLWERGVRGFKNVSRGKTKANAEYVGPPKKNSLALVLMHIICESALAQFTKCVARLGEVRIRVPFKVRIWVRVMARFSFKSKNCKLCRRGFQSVWRILQIVQI